MCTVTYLPTPTGFILTHNRDEAPARSPVHVERVRTASDVLLFPRDTRAGGTWIAAARSGKLAFVLNGAFLKHRHEPPYRRSRGLVLLDFFEYAEPDAFFQNYDFSGIEPFTFILATGARLTQLRWDGATAHIAERNPQAPAFWCSATLYPPDMQERREQVFERWQKAHPEPRIQPATLLRLHRTGSVGDPENDFVMNRADKVRTVSISQVVLKADRFLFSYRELLADVHDRKSISIRK